MSSLPLGMSSEHLSTALEVIAMQPAPVDLEEVRSLIEQGAQVNGLPGRHRSPLYYAAHYGHVDLARLLLAEGADPDYGGTEGKTPLHAVADEGTLHDEAAGALVAMLVAHGANPNQTDEQGQTPLNVACHRLSRGAMIGLLDAGARVDYVDMILCRNELRRNLLGDYEARKRVLMQYGAPDLAALTVADLCLISNLDALQEWMQPDLWRGQELACQRLMTACPPWLMAEIMQNNPEIADLSTNERPESRIHGVGLAILSSNQGKKQR